MLKNVRKKKKILTITKRKGDRQERKRKKKLDNPETL